jgi:hypothetical protein
MWDARLPPLINITMSRFRAALVTTLLYLLYTRFTFSQTNFALSTPKIIHT